MAAQKAMLSGGLDILIGETKNTVKKRKNIVVACPVGDGAELAKFVAWARKTGISEIADFVFIYRAGMRVQDIGLDSFHAVEKVPLGTCGAFFVAQSLSYSLGYEVVVLSDINAFLDSKKGFVACKDLALSSKKAVLPIIYQGEGKMIGNNTYNPNSFGFIPRNVFEEVGFSVPYPWRGGEDYEFRSRLLKHGKAIFTDKAYVRHPMEGFTIYHKMLAKRKYYPYVAGLILAMLLESTYRKASYLKYIAWRMFYSFFADVFSDGQMSEIAQNSEKFIIRDEITEGGAPVGIEKLENALEFNPTFLGRALSVPVSLLSLLLFKRYDTLDDRIVLRESRLRLLLGIIIATILIPIRFCQTLLSLIGWKNELGKIVFPIMPKNLKEAVQVYARLLKEKRL
jgi:hypothetical protein